MGISGNTGKRSIVRDIRQVAIVETLNRHALGMIARSSSANTTADAICEHHRSTAVAHPKSAIAYSVLDANSDLGRHSEERHLARMS